MLVVVHVLLIPMVTILMVTILMVPILMVTILMVPIPMVTILMVPILMVTILMVAMLVAVLMVVDDDAPCLQLQKQMQPFVSDQSASQTCKRIFNRATPPLTISTLFSITTS